MEQNMGRWSLIKKLSGIAGVGVVFQATGCAVDPALIALDFFTLVGTSFISDYVFGAFNLAP